MTFFIYGLFDSGIAANRATWSDVSKRAKQIASMRKTMATPEYRAAASERRRAAWADPVTRARMIAGIRATQSRAAV